MGKDDTSQDAYVFYALVVALVVGIIALSVLATESMKIHNQCINSVLYYRTYGALSPALDVNSDVILCESPTPDERP